MEPIWCYWQLPSASSCLGSFASISGWWRQSLLFANSIAGFYGWARQTLSFGQWKLPHELGACSDQALWYQGGLLVPFRLISMIRSHTGSHGAINLFQGKMSVGHAWVILIYSLDTNDTRQSSLGVEGFGTFGRNWELVYFLQKYFQVVFAVFNIDSLGRADCFLGLVSYGLR